MADKNDADNQSQNLPENSLMLPKKAMIISTAIVFAVSFALYLYTLAPTVTLVDSGELIVAARTLGVAHPPGFPLYVLLAHIATLLPLGNIAVRVHFASAFFAALACTFMTLLVTEALRCDGLFQTSAKQNKDARKKKNKPSIADSITHISDHSNLKLILAQACITGLLFAFSRTLWAYATIAEVYTLNTFLCIVIIFLMINWRRSMLNAKSQHLSVSDKPLYIAAFVFGLALGVHHVTVGLMLPALAALVFATEGIKFFKSKRLLYAALFAFAGLSIYIYLPIAASRSPLMNWGDPRTSEKFWWHITGRQYQTFFDFSLERISEFFRLALREFGYSWLPLALAFALAGLIYLFKRDKTMFVFLSLILAADVVYCLGYEIDEDKDAYYLPAFIALTIAVGFGVHWCSKILQETKLRHVLTPLRTSLVLLIIPAVALAANFAFNNRSKYFIAQDYANNILNTIEPKGMLLTNDWQVYSPILYIREVEHQRKDVVAIDVNQLRRSWYFNYLQQVYPELINQSQQQVADYLEDLKGWEQDPDAYAKNRNLTERINTRFYTMIFSFITNHLKSAPVYATQEIVINRGGPDGELTSFLNEKHSLIPEGLIFKVSARDTLPVSKESSISTRGLNDGTLKFADDDVVTKKVFPVYLIMLTNNGRFFALQNQHEKAIEYFKQALALDASYTPAKTLVNTSLEALKQKQQ
jgi:tetratricopeptide (TPR) repeat protein